MAKNDKKKKTKLERFFAFLHVIEKVFFRVVFPYKKYGNTKIRNDGALITIGNHLNYFDVFYPCLITDRPIHFVAKAELWRGGISEWFVRTCECIPAKRDGTDVQAVKDSMRVLKAGGVINIFPEGRRSFDANEVLPFHAGAAALSIKTQTPIIPVVKVNRLMCFRRAHVIYGDPIEFRQYYGKKVTREQLEECDNILREAVINMRKSFIETHPEVKVRGKKKSKK